MRKVEISVGIRPSAIEALVPPSLFQVLKKGQVEDGFCLLFFDDAEGAEHLCALASSLDSLRALTEAWLMEATVNGEFDKEADGMSKVNTEPPT